MRWIREKEVTCVNGEGCMQMNLQELQTIRHHNLPIRIFVINNEGYHSIRQTQTAYFGGHLVGVGEESGDLSFPDLSRLAPAYGFAYKECRNSATLEEDLRAVMEVPAPVICQVFCVETPEDGAETGIQTASGWNHGVGITGRYVSVSFERRDGGGRRIMERVIVTGATSMIGEALIEECLKHGILYVR